MKHNSPETDWPAPLIAGATLTGLWAVVILAYGFHRPDEGLYQFQIWWKSAPNAFGDALAGAFAALAFLWLVVATFLQKSELQQSTQALRLQAEELKNSVEQLSKQTEIFSTNLHADNAAATQQQIEKRLDRFASRLFIDFEKVSFRWDAEGSVGYYEERFWTRCDVATFRKLDTDARIRVFGAELRDFEAALNSPAAPDQKRWKETAMDCFDTALESCGRINDLADGVLGSVANLRVSEIGLPQIQTRLKSVRDHLQSLQSR